MLAPNTSLAALIGAIPVAIEGNLITSDYHNSLRAAVLALVESIGPGAIQRTFTFAPTFVKNGNLIEWRFTNGVASAPAKQQNKVSGFLAVQLSNGAAIKSMVIRGRKRGEVDGLQAALARQSIAGGTSTPLITIPMESEKTDEQGLFTATGELSSAMLEKFTVTVSGVILEDLRTVDNEQYKYFITADADNVGDLVEIYSIQIICSR